MENFVQTDVQITTWEATACLRWVIRDIPFDPINKAKVLQQRWRRVDTGSQGESEWKDVPTEDESSK